MTPAEYKVTPWDEAHQLMPQVITENWQIAIHVSKSLTGKAKCATTIPDDLT